MIIKWNQPCLTTFGKKGEGRTHLKPGTNNVPDDVGELLIKSPDFIAAKKAGRIEVVVSEVGLTSEEFENGDKWGKYDADQLIDLIAESTSMNDLEELLENKGKGVKAAAKKRIAEIKKAQKGEDD